MYRKGHEEFVGGIEDPEDGAAVAGTIFTAVIVYAVRKKQHVSLLWNFSMLRGVAIEEGHLANSIDTQGFVVFCGLQGMLHVRESRRGAIALQ